MKTLRDTLSWLLLAAFYLLVSLRLYPGAWQKTILETFWHLLEIAPFTVGLTLVVTALLRKLSEGGKLSWPLALRVFITVSIILEFFLGIHDYVS